MIAEGLGLGAAPDAAEFADNGADTLGHLRRHFRARLQLPTLQKLGLANLSPYAGTQQVAEHSWHGRLSQQARYKSPIEDYWELLGAVNQTEPTAYPSGFPQSFIEQLEREFHRPVLVNSPYHPRHLLEDYGQQQVVTGGLLISTSGGSDLFVSAHEETITDEELERVGRFTTLISREATVSSKSSRPPLPVVRDGTFTGPQPSVASTCARPSQR